MRTDSKFPPALSTLLAITLGLLATAGPGHACTCMNWFSGQAPGCFEASGTDPWKVTLTSTAERACLGFAVVQLHAGDGNDYIEGLPTSAVDETIFAEGGDDQVWGREGDDLIYGGAGADNLRGNQGDDKIRGGQGDDTVDGGQGHDELWGDPGDDTVYGKDGDDELYGQAGADELVGGSGDDDLHGGPGDDDLRGGDGSDRYFYNLGDGDDILDDSVGNNTLIFRGIFATSVSTSTLGNGTLVLDISQDGTTGQVQIVGFENRPGWSIAYEDQPNVVLIFADDLGYGDIEPFRPSGSQAPMIYTRHLVRMANEGAKFTQFYSGASHCPPARSALMEGRHTGNTDVNAGGGFSSENLPVMPELLQQKGYRTALVGKWGMGAHSGGTVTNGDPIEMGFDKFLGFMKHRDAHVYYHNNFNTCSQGTTSNPWIEGVHQNLFGYGFDATSTTWPIGSLPSPPETIEYDLAVSPTPRYTHDEFIERAEEVIDIYRREGPFFLYMPMTIPHAEQTVPTDAYVVTDSDDVSHDYRTEITNDVTWHPCQCPDASGGPVGCEGAGTNEATLYPRWNEEVYATYAAMVSRLDQGVGSILDKLASLRLDSNTLVIFTSDNGPHSAANMDPTYFDSTAGLNGEKYQLLEGGIRVPMIVWRPEHVAAGVTRDEPVALWDLLPTIADSAGITAAEVDTFLGGDGADGQSFTALFSDPPGSYTEHDFLYWEHHSSGTHRQAVRVDDLKLLRKKSNDALSLYDLAVDPEESNDLINDASYCTEIDDMIDILNEERSADVCCLDAYHCASGTPACTGAEPAGCP